MNAENGNPAIDEATQALVDSFGDAERETLVDLCRRLVEAPSVNPPGDTRAAAEVVRAFLGARGIPAVCHGPQPELASGVDDHAIERDVVDCAKVYAAAAIACANAAD